MPPGLPWPRWWVPSSDSQIVLCARITWGRCQRCGFRAQQDKHSRICSAVKNLPAMQEAWVQSLGGENPLKEGMETRSSILAWRIPWQRSLRVGGGGGCSPWDHKRIRHNLATIQQQQQGKDSDLAGDGRAQESVVFSKHCRWLWCKYSEVPGSMRS